MWLFLSIDFLQFLSSVSTLGQIKFIQGLLKVNQWPFRNTFSVWVYASVQAIDLVGVFWEHSHQITVIRFRQLCAFH